MSLPEITDPATWRAARVGLLEREKELTRVRDELSAARRELPEGRNDSARAAQPDSAS